MIKVNGRRFKTYWGYLNNESDMLAALLVGRWVLGCYRKLGSAVAAKGMPVPAVQVEI